MSKHLKIVGGLGFIVGSFILGLFILPQKVELVRLREYPIPVEQVWAEVDSLEDWDSWDPWGHKAEQSVRPFASEEHKGELQLTSVDQEGRRLTYKVDAKSAEGDIFVEKIPDGARVFWHHSYMSEFGPFSRMNHWLRRGRLALEFDKGLENLDALLENKSSSIKEAETK